MNKISENVLAFVKRQLKKLPEVSVYRVYKIFPVFIIWTDRILDPWKGGAAAGIFCIIRPKYRDDQGLIHHELTHCKQYIRKVILLHSISWLVSSKYRLTSEAEAYAVQISYYNNWQSHVSWAVELIRDKYKIRESEEEIQRELLLQCSKLGLV